MHLHNLPPTGAHTGLIEQVDIVYILHQQTLSTQLNESPILCKAGQHTCTIVQSLQWYQARCLACKKVTVCEPKSQCTSSLHFADTYTHVQLVMHMTPIEWPSHLTSQGWHCIDLNQPGPVVSVNQHIHPKHFKAGSSWCTQHGCGVSH